MSSNFAVTYDAYYILAQSSSFYAAKAHFSLSLSLSFLKGSPQKKGNAWPVRRPCVARGKQQKRWQRCKLQVAIGCQFIHSELGQQIAHRAEERDSSNGRESGREREATPICALQLPRRRRRPQRSCCIFMGVSVIYTARMATGNWQMANGKWEWVRGQHWLSLQNFH